jgi:hypothetical protein
MDCPSVILAPTVAETGKQLPKVFSIMRLCCVILHADLYVRKQLNIETCVRILAAVRISVFCTELGNTLQTPNRDQSVVYKKI